LNLGKYFGISKTRNEEEIIESLIEHIRIDEEEIILLEGMVGNLLQNNKQQVFDGYKKISKISSDSIRLFEHTVEHIVQNDFCFQKQYDLLRLYQRIENISGFILAAANRLNIFCSINAVMPEACYAGINSLTENIVAIHKEFQNAMNKYQKNKKHVLDIIHKVEEKEQEADKIRVDFLQVIYNLANQNKVKLGDLRAIENIIDLLEEVTDKINEAATSLEWLLIQ
jgi:uncharacterized protein Yka (UPF0111/DUF47 family)